MAAVAFGILIAAAFGCGDFAGGQASASASTLAVLTIAQGCSLAGAAVLSVVVASHAGASDVAYGALAGAVNVIGLGTLYRALARHAAGVVAPLTAVVAAMVPIAWGLLHGERPSVLVLVGIVLAVAGAGLLARSDAAAGPGALARGVMPALGAGIALGSSLVFYSESSAASGQIPVLAGRAAGFVCVMAAFLVARRRGAVRAPTGSARNLAIGAGQLDVSATALLVVAIRHELLSVVAPLAALAPGWTVLLAVLVTRERLGPAQRAGLLVALVALVLIAAG